MRDNVIRAVPDAAEMLIPEPPDVPARTAPLTKLPSMVTSTWLLPGSPEPRSPEFANHLNAVDRLSVMVLFVMLAPTVLPGPVPPRTRIPRLPFG